MAAVVPDPMGAAQAVTTRAQAAKLWQRLDTQIGRAGQGAYPTLPPGWEDDAASARTLLEDNWMSQSDPEGTGGAGAKPKGVKPSGGAGARSPKPSGARSRPGGPRTGARATGRRGGSRSRAGRVGSRASQLPGISSGGPLLITIIGGTLVLVLLWVLLRSSELAPKGKSALDFISSGLTTGLAVLVAPVDPLAPRATRHAAAVSDQARVRATLGGAAAPRASVSSRSPQRRPTHTTH